MTPVVIDASAGVEILADTARGRRLSALLPADVVGWVPEHFYVEVAGVVRHRTIVTRSLPEVTGSATLERLGRWHLRQALVSPLLTMAWTYRHNMTMADAVYVALTIELGGQFLFDDHKLLNGPTFPKDIAVLRLPRRELRPRRDQRLPEDDRQDEQTRTLCSRLRRHDVHYSRRCSASATRYRHSLRARRPWRHLVASGTISGAPRRAVLLRTATVRGPSYRASISRGVGRSQSGRSTALRGRCTSARL